MLLSRFLRFCLLITIIALPVAASARDESSLGTRNIIRDTGEGGGGGVINPPVVNPPVVNPGNDSGNTGGGTVVTNPAGNVITGVAGLVRNVVLVGSRTLEQLGNALEDLLAGKGGRLVAGTADILINEHNVCRWLDGAPDGGADYFVPLATRDEWEAFVDNAPNAVTRSECCLPNAINLEASNGNFFTFNLPIGRVGATNELGVVDISHAFQLERAGDGATWMETVSDRVECTASGWTSTGVTRESEEPPVEPEDPGIDIDTPICGDGYQSTGTFSGVSEGNDTDYTYPLSLQLATGVIPAEARNLRVYYNNNNEMTVQFGGGRQSLVNIRREGSTLYGEFRQPTFAFATMVERMGQVNRKVSWMAIACQPEPEPVAQVVKIGNPVCTNSQGHGGACHWSGNGDDNKNFSPANYQWDNAMYACKKAGYNYLVAATGSDYDDCSGCTWYDWTDRSSATTPLDQLKNHQIPANNAASWTYRRYGSLTNNGGMRTIWCSNSPGQRVPYDCNPTEMTIATSKVTRTQRGRTVTVTRTPGTFTAQLPGGHLINKQRWEVMRPVHPDDTGTVPSSRRNDAHLTPVQGILRINGDAPVSVTRYAECTAGGWQLYHACKPKPGIRGMTATLGTNTGGPGTALCTTNPNDTSFD